MNIRSRRGSKVSVNLPLFFDENTPRPFIDPVIPWERDIYPEDPGLFYCSTILMFLTNLLRGHEWGSTARSYLYGCDGVRDGMLLLAGHIPSV